MLLQCGAVAAPGLPAIRSPTGLVWDYRLVPCPRASSLPSAPLYSLDDSFELSFELGLRSLFILNRRFLLFAAIDFRPRYYLPGPQKWSLTENHFLPVEFRSVFSRAHFAPL